MNNEEPMPVPGDEWSDWFERHGAALVLLARQYVAARADVEDVVQEAFVRFWRTRKEVKEPAAYLYACVKRCALDWQRGRRRRAAREQGAARSETEGLFESGAEERERTLAVEAALGALPREQAEVVVMKVWGGLTFAQIGDALELSPNTAASRYRYAMERLRGALVEEARV